MEQIFNAESMIENRHEEIAVSTFSDENNYDRLENKLVRIDADRDEIKKLNIAIMCINEIVMLFNFSTNIFNIKNEKLLPFGLKGRVKDLKGLSDNKDFDIAIDNRDAIAAWLSERVLLLSRKNAKWIFNLVSNDQSNSVQSRMGIAVVCRAVSILDGYWLKVEGDKTKWEDVDIKRNKLNEIIAQVALHGKSLTLQGSLCSPELTTNGAYAKAWRRYPDHRLWLHKAGENGCWEARIEAMCSRLLDKMNVSHCYYRMTKDENLDVCACPSMTSDIYSIIDGMSMFSYCNRTGRNYDLWMEEIDRDNLYKMWIVDYLISNRDRHGQNYGFYYQPDTMEILRMHPLFDHNNAFDLEYMKNRDAAYQFRGLSIRDAAKYAIKRVDLYFELPFFQSDFLTERQYKEFMWRAKDLGIKTRYNPVWVRYCKKKEIIIEQSTEEFNRLHDQYALTDSSQFYGLVENDYLK